MIVNFLNIFKLRLGVVIGHASEELPLHLELCIHNLFEFCARVVLALRLRWQTQRFRLAFNGVWLLLAAALFVQNQLLVNEQMIFRVFESEFQLIIWQR